jgi:DNA polymerase III subunit alpha
MERVPTLYTELEAIVQKYPGSLIATTACLGSELDGLVLQLIEAEQNKDEELTLAIKIKIDKFIKWCISLFQDDFYIEIAPGTSKDQKAFNQRIKSIASFYQRKIVIGTDAHYLTEEKRAIHKAFLNAKEGEREVDSFYHDTYLMSDEEAYSKLSGIFSKEEFEVMKNNSLEIYNKIGKYEIFHNPIIPEVKVPSRPIGEINDNNYPILTQLSSSENIQERYWVSECLRGLKAKNLWNPEYLTRLETEADVIKHISNQLGNCLFSYFNTFQHYIDLFWECGSVCGPGRGSACGFLSNYLLGITQLDPIKWDLPWFRFLNKERVELPDIDTDLCSAKRPLIFKAIRKERGELNLIQVATFGVEAPKAAIACACRGYRSKDCPSGIDVDIAQYLSSLIPVERGMTRSIKDCIYGNEEKGWKPIQSLIKGLGEYPGLLEIVLEIENVVCRRGQHASGVMLYNNSPYDTTALMRSPNGDLTTQFDLHKSEELGDTKFDYLVTEISDKISVAIDLLRKDGYFSECKTKREIYNKYFHPESIDVNDPELWRALAEDNIQDVFQFNTQIGKEAIKAIQPKSPQELTAANALIRLSAPEGQDRPYDRYIRFKKDISLWYKEMDEYGLTKEEQKILEPYYLQDYGVPASQEALMRLCMDKNISNFTLGEANACRKIVAKKQVKKIPELKEKFIKACPSEKLGKYAWQTMMEP